MMNLHGGLTGHKHGHGLYEDNPPRSGTLGHLKAMNEHEQMIDDCEKRESRLTDGQRVLIDSYAKQLRDGRSLTKRQADVLDDIWNSATERG